MRTDEESQVLAAVENCEKGPCYDPQRYTLMAEKFVDEVVQNGKVDWVAFEKEANNYTGSWSFVDTQRAFYRRLLDLGLLSFHPNWNYHIMTRDSYGTNPCLHGLGLRSLYFTRYEDALGYATALYRERGISIFKLQPTQTVSDRRQLGIEPQTKNSTP